jgi:hypothetical protein
MRGISDENGFYLERSADKSLFFLVNQVSKEADDTFSDEWVR